VTNQICKMTGAEFPLFAFSHCRDVVAAVTNAGGFGVLGGSSFTPESLEEELAWIDRQVEGKPYGIDILFPENMPASAKNVTAEQLAAQIGERHIQFVVDLLNRNGIKASATDVVRPSAGMMTAESTATALLDVAFRHPIRMVVNALGIAPPQMVARAKAAGVPVGALVGAKEHAIRQVKAGVDFLVAQGSEAGGHCGEVSTLVLVPEVVRAVPSVPVLAAGGIMTGEQMLACMSMGAQGAWTGSVWLATAEAETSPVFREKMVEAASRDTVRAKVRTGKPSRQLRSKWHEAWEAPDSPGPLPMPLMGILAQPAFALINSAAEAGNPQARELVSYFVGQGVGLVDAVRSARSVVQTFKEEFAAAYERLQGDVGV
jgi:NAD(P)H-dependent flavin oxidoreductase YrpB (nitropropane dioxygenase family)